MSASNKRIYIDGVPAWEVAAWWNGMPPGVRTGTAALLWPESYPEWLWEIPWHELAGSLQHQKVLTRYYAFFVRPTVIREGAAEGHGYDSLRRV